MSVQTLSTEELPDSAADFSAAPPDAGPWALRIFAVGAVCLGVAALAAATFVLSYSPIRAVALQASITPRLARGYPLLLDAMLIIVLAAVLALRGAGLPSRLLAWLTLLLVMAAAAGADALNAAGHKMPHQAAAITAAVLPFVLVLTAFALLLAMLRYARLRRVADTADRVAGYESGWAMALPSLAPATLAQTMVAQSTVEQALVLPAETAPPLLAPPDLAPPDLAPPDLAMADDTADHDPSSDDNPTYDDDPTYDDRGEPATGTSPYPADSLVADYDDDADTDTGDGSDDPGDSGPSSSSRTVLTAPPALPELTTEEEGADEIDDPEGPVFHRLFSAPVPPTQPGED